MPLLLTGALSPSRLELSTGASRNATGAMNMYKQCDELKDIFERLENSTGTDTLLRYLHEILSLAFRFDTQTLVRVLKQSRLVNLTLEGDLPRAIAKLGHYRAIAKSLAKAVEI
jgi:hypothetical protein